jgi:hypothetical protein
MKTAMQKLISELKTIESYDYIVVGIIKRAEVLLELEKQMVIDAVNTTEKNAVDFCNAAVVQYWNHEGLFDVVPDAGIKYYNEKFKDNE